MSTVDDEAPTTFRGVVAIAPLADPERTRTSSRAPIDESPQRGAASVPTAPRAHRNLDRQVATVVAHARRAAGRDARTPRSHAREYLARGVLLVVVAAASVTIVALGHAPSTARPGAHRSATTAPRAVPHAPPALRTAAAPGEPSPSPPSARRATRRGTAPTHPPSVSDAARLLAAGAYLPALEVYRTLAVARPGEPVYALIARVLARDAAARCNRRQEKGETTCSTRDDPRPPLR